MAIIFSDRTPWIFSNQLQQLSGSSIHSSTCTILFSILHLKFLYRSTWLGVSFFLVFLWTVAIEEQFYLFWSVLLKYFKKYFVTVCFTLIIISLVFRGVKYENDSAMVFHTFSALSNFAIGALAGYLAFYRLPVFERPDKAQKEHHCDHLFSTND